VTKDIGALLDDWGYDANRVNARWILDEKGLRVVQLRVDMGLLQMATHGRPDGTRPHGFDSLCAYYQDKETRLLEDARMLELDGDECHALQQEAMQYYYRYLAFYALRHLDGVIDDTRHNLALLELISRCVDDEDLVWSFKQYFPYGRMMHARAVCEKNMEREAYDVALNELDEAIGAIRGFLGEHDEEGAAESDELEVLEGLRQKVETKRPRSQQETLRLELDRAIAREEYERAAELRDELNENVAKE
jgi:hypothetical protein